MPPDRTVFHRAELDLCPERGAVRGVGRILLSPLRPGPFSSIHEQPGLAVRLGAVILYASREPYPRPRRRSWRKLSAPFSSSRARQCRAVAHDEAVPPLSQYGAHVPLSCIASRAFIGRNRDADAATAPSAPAMTSAPPEQSARSSPCMAPSSRRYHAFSPLEANGSTPDHIAGYQAAVEKWADLGAVLISSSSRLGDRAEPSRCRTDHTPGRPVASVAAASRNRRCLGLRRPVQDDDRYAAYPCSILSPRPEGPRLLSARGPRLPGNRRRLSIDPPDPRCPQHAAPRTSPRLPGGYVRSGDDIRRRDIAIPRRQPSESCGLYIRPISVMHP